MSLEPCVISSRPLEVGLIAACASYAGEVVEWLNHKEYLAVPVEEVMAELRKLGAPSIVSARSAAMKKVRASKKKSSTAEIAEVKTKPEMLLPFCGVVEPTWCMGIRFNHGLHTQCMKAPTNGEYCATCFKSAKNSASGKPTYGNIKDRLTGELLEFRDPKGKKTSCYANVAEKLGLDIEKAQMEAEKFGWTIPENQLTVQVVKRGRPASKKQVVKAKGKRGRPAKKASDKSSEMTLDAQIAQLVAEAAEDVMEVDTSTTSTKKKVTRKTSEEKEAEKQAKKQAKEAEKAAKKQAKEAEKLAKKQAKEAEKQAKEAEKAAKKAAKEAEKAAKKAAKEAEKQAKKEAKEAAKAAKKAAKKAAPSKTEVKKQQLQKEAAELGLEIADAQLKNLKIGEIRDMIKAHKKAARAANKAAKAVKKANKVAQEAEQKAEQKAEQNDGFYLVNYPPYRIPAADWPKTAEKKTEYALAGEASIANVTSFEPQTIEEKVDDAMAELDAEMVVDGSDDEEDEEDDELSIDPDSTPTVTIDGSEYYRVTYGGQENVLVSMEGELVGVYDEDNNEILDVEFEE